MPESRHRAKHHRHQPGNHHANTANSTSRKTQRSAALVVAALAAIFGLAVAYFTQGGDFFWLVVGAAAGAILGYLVGHNMDKSIQKR